MEILYAFSNLFEELAALELSYPAGRAEFLDVLVKRDPIDVFHDKVYLLWGLNQLDQLDDLWMACLLKDSDLPLNGLLLHWVRQLVLLVDLQCKLLLIRLVMY